MDSSLDNPKPRKSHVFNRDYWDHYLEPEWVSERLFEVEDFKGPILDPACGWGRILVSAKKHGFETMGSDIVADRDPKGCDHFRHYSFLHIPIDRRPFHWWTQAGSIVCNPPFENMQNFIKRACSLMYPDRHGDRWSKTNIIKVAMICPIRRLPAATWLEKLPLARVLMLTPRPSMPTAQHIEAGGKIGGGTQDFCWLIFKLGWHTGRLYAGRWYPGRPAAMGWLHRDK
jgi:hypothetical protein